MTQFKSPVYNVLSIPLDRIQANSYNPNSVAPPEMALLETSIWEDGFTKPVVTLMTAGGIWSTIVNLSIFVWARHSGRSIEEAMTMTFMSLVLIQFFKAYNFRSDRHSVLNKTFANKWLNIAIVWELILLVLIIYLPFLHKPFGTYSLPLFDWIVVLVLSGTVVPVLEIVKWMIRRGWFEKN
jgi:Ca2+-transporting ATPase